MLVKERLMRAHRFRKGPGRVPCRNCNAICSVSLDVERDSVAHLVECMACWSERKGIIYKG